MAKAEIVEVKKPDVVLTLSWEEAEMLVRLIGNHIGGSGENRDMSDGIYMALKDHVDDIGSLKADYKNHIVYLR